MLSILEKEEDKMYDTMPTKNNPHYAPMQLIGALLFLCLAFVSSVLYAADDEFGKPFDSSWRIAVGTQWSKDRPELHYTILHDDSNPELFIPQSSTSDMQPLFSRCTLEKQLTGSSALSLAYSRDAATSLLVGKKNVRIPIPFLRFLLRRPDILVRTTAQAPVTLDMQLLRVRYEHSIARPAGVELGGGIGVQALYAQAKAAFPVLGYSKEEYFLLLPLFSLYARAQPWSRLRSTLRADYLPIHLEPYDGTLADVECTIEYKLNSRFFVGAGGRYALKSFSMEDDDNRLNASYHVVGAMLFTGIFL